MTPPRGLTMCMLPKHTGLQALFFRGALQGARTLGRHRLRRKKLLLSTPFGFTLSQKGTSLSPSAWLRGNGSQNLVVIPACPWPDSFWGNFNNCGSRYISGAHGHSCVLEKQTIVPHQQELPTANPNTWPQAKVHDLGTTNLLPTRRGWGRY